MATIDDLHPLVATAVHAHALAVEVLRCDAELADTEAFCRAYGFAADDSVNTILVAGKSSGGALTLVACALLATDRLDVNGAVRRRLGAKKASFASSEVAAEATAMERGGVTILGLPASIPVWIDGRVAGRERIILGGGNRTSKVLVAPDELRRVPGVEFVEGLTITSSR